VETERDVILKRLAASRAELVEACRELDRDTWTQPVYGHGEEVEWTAMDLLRHLVWAEGGMLRLMTQIRAGEEGVPADFDLDRYNASGIRKLKDELPADLLLRLEQNRKDVLAFMDSLEEGDWEKQGRHGSLRILTIGEILKLIASHEEQHLADLRRVLS
jgi:hypothetical protein